ncbi:MAG: hypothetical protein ACJAVI_001891 [Candidatus Azotimanducaceae bacterium]
MNIEKVIAKELGAREAQVVAAIELLDSGSTVPFISRYRKEATGGLDDTQLRNLEERLGYLRELEQRREAIVASITEQGKLTPELQSAIMAAETKVRLEDLYLPYKQKRRTKAQIAIEAGLEPLANSLLADPTLDPANEAQAYINKDEAFKAAFDDTKGVLDGAKYILMERFAENAELLQSLREYMHGQAVIFSNVVPGKENEAAKFRDYFDLQDKYTGIPSHRALAMLRGRREGLLQLRVDVEVPEGQLHPCISKIASCFEISHQARLADDWIGEVVSWTWRVKLQLHLETELMSEMRAAAEEAAIHVFALNIKDLLLAAPAGQKVTIGLDPGLRTGVKLAVVDSTGQFVDSATIYPHAPQNKWQASIAVLESLVRKHNVELLAIGNGTASRETDRLCADLMTQFSDLKVRRVVVSEAGASVYSASELASKEFPDLDVTIRGAVSIARRLQDPLAELVKIEPRSIGVGQYQHDVNQSLLGRNLDAVVEDCVNAVGVEVNTASAALLRRVAGLNQSIADNIVTFRNENGRFSNREQLKSVARLGERTFEQAAGFLRIQNGDNPLDASAVHPETYAVVERIAAGTNTPVSQLIGNRALNSVNHADYADEQFGVVTIKDICSELEKPGRDPRPEFKTASLKDGVEKISDLEEGMRLQGTISNVTNFGAFVDIGVHQDGLVHISALADRFVKDPHEVVKAGDIVNVRVLEIDLERKRIALTMRSEEKNEERESADKVVKGKEKRPPSESGKSRTKNNQGKKGSSANSNTASNRRNSAGNRQSGGSSPIAETAFAQAFAKAQQKESDKTK